MTVETLRYRSGGLAALVAVSLVAALLAGNIASSSFLGVLFAIGLVVAVVVFAANPFVGVVILAGAVPIENTLAVAPGATALKYLGVLLAAVWFFRKLLRGEAWKPLLSAPLTVAAAIFVAFALASSIWAESTSAAVVGVFQLGMMLAWCLLVMDLVDSQDRVELIVQVLVASGVTAAGLTLQQGLLGARRAGEEIAGSANATAVMMLALMPFAFYLLRTSRRLLWRLVGFVYICLSVTAIMLTYSRMVLILVGPVFLYLCWQTIRGGRGRGWVLTLAAAALLGFALFVPWEKVQRRAETIPEYVEGVLHPVGTGISEYSGRGYHMRVAVVMGLDHPVAGVGYNNYGRRFNRQYQYFVRGAPGFYGSFRSPHSGWPGLFAELGIVGVGLWTIVLGLAFRHVGRVWIATRTGPNTRFFVLAQALVLSLLLYAVPYGFYLQTHKEKLLWALLALAVVTGRVFKDLGTENRAVS